MLIPAYIQDLINQGEGARLDFKQTVNNYSKIAKSIVSFANTHGGILLVGVRDNGTIGGVSPEEYKFVLQHAIEFYCRPQPNYHIVEWVAAGHTILECVIEEGQDKPYYAQGADEKLWVHVRVHYKCLLASKTTVDFMRQQASETPVEIEYGKVEQGILNLLQDREKITLKEACRKLNISYRRGSRTIVKLMSLGVIRSHTTEKEEYYTAT